VLWIGFLQWHIRTQGRANVAEPVVHDYGNIEHRDAVLAYDRQEPMTDAAGKVLTRWDGETVKPHPVTGQPVPDEASQVVQWRYVNPRQAEWPKADFIVGNPPFIGNKRMRVALGDGYADALRAAWPEVPESADFVMYWWHKAAETVRQGQAERFGLITTNSLTMIFNRRVIESHQTATPPLSLAYAVPDHPWVDSADGAAVRISMSVGVRGTGEGKLQTVTQEREAEGGEVAVELLTRQGVIHADLKVGANVTSTVKLRANAGLSSMGMMRAGKGFEVADEATARKLGLGRIPGLTQRLRPFRNGKDLTGSPRGYWLIDLFGLSEAEVRSQFPEVYQWVLERVKPERDLNRRPRLREQWWVFGEPRQGLRAALKGLPRYIGTVETAKHRVFTFLDAAILPDHKLVAIAMADAYHLGVLSSRLHVEWALASGGTLEDRPVYSKSRCFDPFPFPDLDPAGALAERIRSLAEQIDAHRKTQLAAHPDATLTATYNVLEKLRSGEALTAKEKVVHEHGLVGVLKSLHDELDAAVLQAYGWADLGPVPWRDDAARAAWTETLLERLVALNARRAAEEAAGTIRWLRPEFQDPARRHAAPATPATQADIELVGGSAVPPADATAPDTDEDSAPAATATPATRQPWPADLPEQMRAVADTLATSAQPLDLDALAARFTGRGPWKKRLPQILETLEVLGKAQREAGGRWRGA